MKLKVGDEVMVMNTAMGGRVVEEGLAIIRRVNKGSTSNPNSYAVEFLNESGITFERFLNPNDLRKAKRRNIKPIETLILKFALDK